MLQYGPAIDNILGLDPYKQTISKYPSQFLESVAFLLQTVDFTNISPFRLGLHLPMASKMSKLILWWLESSQYMPRTCGVGIRG